MEVQGTIIRVFDKRSGTTERGEWASQEYEIEYRDGNVIRKMMFEVRGVDRINRFAIKTGQNVSVLFAIECREYNGRIFNSVNAWDVRPVAEVAQASTDAI